MKPIVKYSIVRRIAAIRHICKINKLKYAKEKVQYPQYQVKI